MGSIVGYTKTKIDALLALLAPLASPTFTGVPAAPTAAAADNSTKLATTAFVATATGPLAPKASPTFTGAPAAPTQVSTDNSTKIATTAFVAGAVSPLAPLASPALTGTPTAPTAASTDSSTALATTAFVSASKVPVINTQSAVASYTLVLSDTRKIIEMLNASANTITIPPNTAVAFPVGTELRVVQTGAGKTSIAAGAGVTINSPGGLLGCRVQWSTITLRKRGADLWILSDDVG